MLNDTELLGSENSRQQAGNLTILYITQFFSPTSGGGELLFYDWAEGMVRRGHHVEVICQQIPNFRKDQSAYLIINRIKPILEHKGELPPSIIQNIRYIINAIIKGSQIIRQKKIDIIHTNAFGPMIVGSILAKIHNIPVVSTIHDIFARASPDYWKKWATQNEVSRISSAIGPLFEKISVNMPTDVILTVSNASKQNLVKFNVKDSNITVIPNGIDVADYDNLGFENNYQNYVVFIGRSVFYKNLEVVISSFKEVTQKLPEAKLVIIGDGPMRHRWERMVSELNLNQNIKFTGYIPQEKKVELLSKCSALLLPSLFEGFGLVLLEAFAMSKPVLVADVKPFDEIVEEGVDGFMIAAHDPVKWAEKITFLLSHKPICEIMGCKGRYKAEKEFNIEKVLDRLESLYVELCSRRKIKAK
jgi:glycosyltransferase involved in cell wall biosynthesis